MSLNERIFKHKSMEQIAERYDPRLAPARLAPSAVNSQPWYFVHEGDTIHVYCNWKGRCLDAGSTLAHLDVAKKKSFRFFKAEHMTGLPGYGNIGSCNN